MSDSRGNLRVLPPSDDGESLREFGRQLAMDSLLGMAMGKRRGKTAPWAAGNLAQRAMRLVAEPWRKAAVLIAALAASLVIGVAWWQFSRPGAPPDAPEVAQQESSGPRPGPNQAPGANTPPVSPRVVPFSAASSNPQDNVPPSGTGNLPGPATVDLLAVHETLAVFEGLGYRICEGQTPQCPKECGDSGEFAAFDVKKYLKYERRGPYGDPKQKTLTARVSDYDKRSTGDPKILQTAKGLKKGDYVLLYWHHECMTKEGTSFPERPIIKLEKIAAHKAEALLRAGK